PAGGRGVDAEKSGVCLQPIIACYLALAVAHLDHILDGRIPLLLDQYLVSPTRDLDLSGKIADGCAVEENGRILRRDIEANEALDPLKRQLIRELLAAHQIIALLKRRIPGMLGADHVASGLKFRGEGGRERNRHTVNKPVKYLFNIRRGDIELGRQRTERETHFRSLLSGFDHPLKRLKAGRPRLDLRIAREREEGALKIDGKSARCRDIGRLCRLGGKNLHGCCPGHQDTARDNQQKAATENDKAEHEKPLTPRGFFNLSPKFAHRL